MRAWHFFGLQDPNDEHHRESGDDGHAANGIEPEMLWSWVFHVVKPNPNENSCHSISLWQTWGLVARTASDHAPELVRRRFLSDAATHGCWMGREASSTRWVGIQNRRHRQLEFTPSRPRCTSARWECSSSIKTLKSRIADLAAATGTGHLLTLKASQQQLMKMAPQHALRCQH